MIVCVETNFILEIAFLQDEHESCSEILNLAEAGTIQLAIPAFCIGEPYYTWAGRDKRRKELQKKLADEVHEITRADTYKDSKEELEKLTSLLVKSAEEDKVRLDESWERILKTATIIPISLRVVQAALRFQGEVGLKPFDSIVYASLIEYLTATVGAVSCFITKNSKDFSNPDIRAELNNLNCKLLTKFKDALGYIHSHP